jgi:hypothetical protein
MWKQHYQSAVKDEVTNSAEHSLSWEGDSRSAGQEIPLTFMKIRGSLPCSQEPTTGSFLSQMNPIHVVTFCFSEMQWRIMMIFYIHLWKQTFFLVFVWKQLINHFNCVCMWDTILFSGKGSRRNTWVFSWDDTTVIPWKEERWIKWRRAHLKLNVIQHTGGMG